ncbi:MAG TPA: hypothetical protein VLP43_08685 [Solirubrobacteraceae bacterium]|nr:hypothetical protein [Solirubrobacteraceae bacterium]
MKRSGLIVVLPVLFALLSCASSAVAATRCAPLLSPRTLPAIRALDPKPRAPRVFAVQYRQAAANVTFYGSFRATVECLLAKWVLPYRATGRPNVVVFDEDMGLATLGVGARGAAARRLFNRASGAGCVPDCALGSLAVLARSYGGPLARYRSRFPGVGSYAGVFVAATDTIVRAFLAPMSDAARRYGIYVVASGDLPAFRQSAARGEVRAFADPALHARSAYVATSAAVHNVASSGDRGTSGAVDPTCCATSWPATSRCH